MPAITSTPPNQSTAPSVDVSIAQISPIGSSFIDSPVMTSASSNTDQTVNSNATYTIGGRGDPMRHQLLEEIECPGDLFEFDYDPQYSRLNSTYQVPKSRVDVDRLPVTDDEIFAPLVELCAFDQPHQVVSENSAFMGDGISPILKTFPGVQMSLDSATSDEQQETSRPNAMREGRVNKNISRHSPVHAVSKRSADIEAAKQEAEHQKDEEKEQSSKKAKPPSIREIQNASMPKTKPKPPSRSQLMMEKIKASIEADKRRPRKAIKSRLSELFTAPSIPLPKTPTDENERMTHIDGSGKPSVSRDVISRHTQPLKTVNVRALIAPPSATSRPPPKPRLSLQPTVIPVKKPGNDINASKKHQSAKRTEGATTIISQRSTSANASITRSKLVRTFAEAINTSRHLPAKPPAAIPESDGNSFRLKRLNVVVRAFEAVSVVLNYAIQKAENKICALSQEKRDLERRLSSVVEKYEYAVSVLGSEHSRHLENVARTHKEEIDSIQQEYEKQLATCKEEMRQALDEQRRIHESEIEVLIGTHQIQIATLESKLGEAEKRAEQLVRDKEAFKAALSKDANEEVAERVSLTDGILLTSDDYDEQQFSNLKESYTGEIEHEDTLDV